MQSAYHKQFVLPVTPNNMSSQVFGAEKQLQQAMNALSERPLTRKN